MEHPDFQEIADAQEHLDAVIRLNEKVLGPRLEGGKLDDPVTLLGNHQDRQIIVLPEGPELVHDLKPFHVGHVQVKNKQVGLDGLVNALDFIRITYRVKV